MYRTPTTGVTALLVGLAAACGGPSGGGSASPQAAAPSASPSIAPAAEAAGPGALPSTATQRHEVRGTVESIAADRAAVTLDHEAIPGLMPAMKMEYAVHDRALLASLKKGDRVQGTLEATGDHYVITELQKR